MCSTWEKARMRTDQSVRPAHTVHRNTSFKLRQDFKKENAVLIRMGDEIEENPLPRASGCRNVTCIGGKNVGEEENGEKNRVRARTHQPRHRGRPI
jgi:hypothetical protein